MENQHRRSKGDRELDESEIEAMNDIKEFGIILGRLVKNLRGCDGFDQRWISIGATDLQKGLMALARGVTQPEFF